MRITFSGASTQGITKQSAPVMDSVSAKPITFLIFFTSWFPQYWAARTPEPLTIPNTSNVNTKNTLLARPTAAMVLSPREPIISVSARFTSVFNMPCIATGRAIRNAFDKKILSRSMYLVSAAMPLTLRPPPASPARSHARFLWSYFPCG